MSNPDEMCVMIPAEKVQQKFGLSRNFLLANECGLQEICDLANGKGERFAGSAVLRRRAEADHLPEFKHLISYMLVTLDGQLLAYRRAKSGGEGRLHDKLSIGFGGHITDKDCEEYESRSWLWSSPESLTKAALRELHEELEIKHDVDLHYAGAISDDSNEVGKVHLGLVYEARLINGYPIPKAKEDCITDLRRCNLSWLKEPADNGKLESWSRILVDHVLKPDRTTFF